MQSSDSKTKNIIVSVLPRSSKTEIVAENDNLLKIKLKAAPIKGEANAELIKFLAKKYGVGKSRIEIIKGLTAKEKLVRIYLP